MVAPHFLALATDAAVTTQDGGFLLAGTSYSGKGLDKKEDSKGQDVMPSLI